MDKKSSEIVSDGNRKGHIHQISRICSRNNSTSSFQHSICKWNYYFLELGSLHRCRKDRKLTQIRIENCEVRNGHQIPFWNIVLSNMWKFVVSNYLVKKKSILVDNNVLTLFFISVLGLGHSYILLKGFLYQDFLPDWFLKFSLCLFNANTCHVYFWSQSCLDKNYMKVP